MKIVQEPYEPIFFHFTAVDNKHTVIDSNRRFSDICRKYYFPHTFWSFSVKQKEREGTDITNQKIRNVW